MIVEISNNLPQFLSVTTNIQNLTYPTTTLDLKTPKIDSGISSNMWWADLKARIGQRFNFQGIISSAKIITTHQNLALPHLTVPDIGHINWVELKNRGFNGVVFDKDNTLTIPYKLTLWAPLESSVEECKAAFGEDNVAVYSNTAGLYEYDADGAQARELERQLGVRVVRHKLKKPGGNGEEIEKHFGFSTSKMVMVGDRVFTDVVYGNRNGFLTVLTKPFSLVEENFVVRQVRKIEACLVGMFLNRGVKPKIHDLVAHHDYLALIN